MRRTSVVQVQIDGDTITIDGAVLPEAAESISPFDRALSVVAARATRRRPVRAEITEVAGVSRCLVTADGRAQELRFTLNPTEGEGGVAASLPAVVATGRMAQAREQTRVAVPWRSVVAVATAVAVLSGIGFALGHVPQRLSPAAAEVAVATTASTPVAQPVRPGARFRPMPTLIISAVAQVGGIVFVGDRVRAEIDVDGVVHQMRLGPDGVLVDGLAPGPHTWTAVAAGHLPASGTVVVLAPEPSPALPTRTVAPSQPKPTAPLTFSPPVDPDRTD